MKKQVFHIAVPDIKSRATSRRNNGTTCLWAGGDAADYEMRTPDSVDTQDVEKDSVDTQDVEKYVIEDADEFEGAKYSGRCR
jgi:hypothetical protein